MQRIHSTASFLWDFRSRAKGSLDAQVMRVRAGLTGPLNVGGCMQELLELAAHSAAQESCPVALLNMVRWSFAERPVRP